MTKTAYSYIRWSSAQQTEGDSFDRQDGLAARYANQHGLELSDRTYVDSGISAFKGKNAAEGELRAFLDACDAGTIERGSYLLVENFDRLSRASVLTALSLFQEIVGRGITIVTLKDGRVFSTSSIEQDWTQLLMALLSMVKANAESADKSMRVKSALHAQRANYMKKGVCPQWLKLSADRTEYIVIQEKAAIVQRIFELSLAGNGINMIAKRLNSDGVEVPRTGKRKVKNDYWTGQQISRLLQNEAVIGTLVSTRNLDPLPNYYPAIVEPTIYYKVQENFKARANVTQGKIGTHVANLFAGLAYCVCGSRFRFVGYRGRGTKSYLVCQASNAKGKCKVRPTQYEALEDDVLAWLLFDQDEEVVPLTNVKRTDPTLPLQAELMKLSEQRERLYELVMSGTLKDTADAGRRINEVDEKVAAVKRRLEEVKVPLADPREAIERAVSLYIEHQEQALADDKTRYTEIRHELQTALRKIIRQMVIHDETVRDGQVYVEYDVTFAWDDEPFHRSYLRPLRRAWNKKS